MHQCQRGLGFVRRDAEIISNLVNRGSQIARLIEQPDDMARNQRGARIGGERANLSVEMVSQRYLGGAQLFPIGCIAKIAPSRRRCAPFGIAGQSSRAVASVPITVDRSEIERRIAFAAAQCDQLVGGRIFGQRRHHFAALWLIRLGRGRIEQRVGLKRLGNEAFNFEIGGRQQLDRLLQLRRHHQRLGLPKIKARAESHACQP